MVFCRNEHDWVLFCAKKGVFFLTRKGQESRVESQRSKVKGQRARVESQESRVESQESRVKGQGSRVESQGTRVKSRESRVESQENGWCVSAEKREEKREIGKKRHVFWKKNIKKGEKIWLCQKKAVPLRA